MLKAFPVINHQQPLKKESREDGELDVFKVWPTFQGEGPYVGCPAVFVRLYGCNLRCSFCDTDYTSGFIRVTPESLVSWVQQFRTSGLVVLTGGEPLRQNIAPFMRELVREEKFRIQVETNGTLYQDIPLLFTTVVCSPKTPEINEDIKPRIDHLKYVLAADSVDPIDGLPMSVLGDNRRPCRPWRGFRGSIYIQPEDSGEATRNAANLDAAKTVCMKYGYILCIQLHKVIGVE